MIRFIFNLLPSLGKIVGIFLRKFGTFSYIRGFIVISLLGTGIWYVEYFYSASTILFGNIITLNDNIILVHNNIRNVATMLNGINNNIIALHNLVQQLGNHNFHQNHFLFQTIINLHEHIFNANNLFEANPIINANLPHLAIDLGNNVIATPNSIATVNTALMNNIHIGHGVFTDIPLAANNMYLNMPLNINSFNTIFFNTHMNILNNSTAIIAYNNNIIQNVYHGILQSHVANPITTVAVNPPFYTFSRLLINGTITVLGIIYTGYSWSAGSGAC